MAATRESTRTTTVGEAPGAIARVVDVVVDPRAAFQAIAGAPTWAAALVVLIALRFTSVFVFYQPETTAGKLVAGVAFQFATIVPMVLASATLLWVACRAWSIALGWLIAFAIAVHVTLAYTVVTTAIASVAAALLPASVDVDLRQPPFVNLSALAGPESSRLATRGLGEIDIRSVYAMTLVAIGIRAAVPAAPRARVVAATATCVAVRVVVLVWTAA